MEYKEFTSEQGWFTIQLPSNWAEYEDEDGTYAFFDEANWKGNFRITPLKWDNKKEIDKVPKQLAEELEDNSSKNAIMTKIGHYDCVFNKEYVNNENEESVIYYWTLGKNNNLFLCSFATDKSNEGTEATDTELIKVKNIIKSIKIN